MIITVLHNLNTPPKKENRIKMMVRSHCYCYFLCLISFLLQTLAFPTLSHCRHDQRDALLDFKYEFPVLWRNPTTDHTSLSSWNKSNDDCCSWEYVTCDAGKVISLDLESIFLNNSLKPNSSLFKLQHLRYLSLSDCSLYGEIPSSLGNLSRLTTLDLSINGFVGQFPAPIVNLTQLMYLDLNQNKFSGNLPLDMSGFHTLNDFVVFDNSFSGLFPTFLFIIPSLESVDLGGNQFKGPIEFGNTSSSSSLKSISLADNQFDGLIPESTCEFLNLTDLDLFNNKLEGEVPSCLWRLTSKMSLSHNSFSSFEKSWEVINETKMRVLDLNSNLFKEPFPNWICKFRSLLLLDLSNNSFSGSIPSCLRNSFGSLEALILHDNKFVGILPDIFFNATELTTLDVSRNQLEGKLPKSLINCKDMVFLNVESNRIKDKFPSWLGSFPSLHVLLLGSNQFYGSLYHHHVSIGFESLKVIDISDNDVTGTLPSFYFSNWLGMSKSTKDDDFMYMNVGGGYYDRMEIVHKGVDTKFGRIRKDFKAIDFSGNRFFGNIPESIGLLKELRLLNLSGNTFTSNIPQSLANLTKLEQLDVSRNQLSGQIPRDLGSLSFLSTMNFSHNNLEGPIPRGTQFHSQNCSSFMDNPKLNGLEEICGKADHVPNPAPQETEKMSEPEEQWINWIAAAIAYGPGLFCGMVIGHIFASHKHEWLIEKFGRNKPRVVAIRAR